VPELPPNSRRRLAAALATLLALALGAIAWGARVGQLRTLHLINATAAEVRVQLPDASWVTVPSGERQAVVVGEGAHVLRLEGEATTGQLEAPIQTSFVERFLRQPLFVVNLGGAAALLRQETVYGDVALEAAPDRLLGPGPFLALDHVDFPFQPFPDQAPRQGVAVRVAWLRGAPADVAAALPPDAPEALDALERALQADPGDARTLAAWVQRVQRADDADRELRVLEQGLDRRPLRVGWHRHYQDALQRRGRWDELRSRYDTLLAEAPQDADRLYLKGRLAARAGDAVQLYRRATAVDAEHHAAWRGLAVLLAGRGEWETAWEACERAGDGSDPDLDELRFRLRVARGDLEALTSELEEARRERALDPNLLRRQLEVAVAGGHAQAAQQTQRAYAQTVRQALGEDPQQLGLLSRLWLAGLLGAAEQVLEASADLQDTARRSRLRLRALAELGRLEEARALLQSARDPWPHLQLAVAALAHGQEPDPWVERALELAAAGSPRQRVLAEALRSGQGLDQVVAPALDRATLSVVLAAQHPGRAAALTAEAERLARRPVFPARLIHRAVARLRG
jgi:hypothetical protein